MIITKDILDEKVPRDMLPTRLDSAMNLYTNISFDDKSGLILYNTNPTTWNCLYSFYEMNHKFTLDNYELTIENPTYRQLIDEYQKLFQDIHEKQNGQTKEVRKEILVSEYQKLFGLNEVQIGDELMPIYELKYSKSANKWTLYYFENYIANHIDNLDDLLNQEIYAQKVLPIDASIKELDGVEVGSNIPYMLSLEENISKIENNLIIKDNS